MRLDRLKLFYLWLSVSVLLAGLVFPRASVAGTAQNAQYVISSVTVEKVGNSFQLLVTGQAPPAYTMYELVDPLRIVLDVADARFDGQLILPAGLPLGPVREVKHTALPGQTPMVARLEIMLEDEPAYTVARHGNNIVVNFPPAAAASQGDKSKMAASGVALSASLPVQTTTRLTGVEVDTANPAETLVYLKTDGPLAAFQKGHVAKAAGKPARLYIDLPNVKMQGKGVRKKVGTSVGLIRAAQRDTGVRVVFESGLSGVFPYEVESQPDGLLIRIAEPAGVAAPILADLAKAQQETAPQPSSTPPLPSQAIPSKKPLPALSPAAQLPVATSAEAIVPKFGGALPQPKGKPGAVAAAAKESASSPVGSAKPRVASGFGGYTKQKITVDFFKIDLHNVFRLFGEISGQNIVVDEAVSGTLTLALHEVPWDFALDIILNLKDLQKEERHNTIVIAPKKKELNWPKSAADTMETKGESAIVLKPDPAIVAQQLKARKEILEAKKYIRQGQEAEKAGQNEQALAQYETALGLWQDNVQLATHLASLCLVQLSMPAKAVHYAKIVLDQEPGNTEAALHAAIGSAHMKDIGVAKQFFDLAISGPKPVSAALLSYAAFAEEQQSYNGALALLSKHSALYGETIETLVSRARILDKQGETAKADAAYNAIMLSGYDVPEELRRYIQGRMTAKN